MSGKQHPRRAWRCSSKTSSRIASSRAARGAARRAALDGHRSSARPPAPSITASADTAVVTADLAAGRRG